jgi:tetratricopeptide (TPR) repeat protein
MKLVQKILSHGLLIAFIVAAFFAYTNRTKLFPQWFGKTEKAVQQAANETPEGAPAPAERKVSRPMPEKTLSKKPVAPLEEATHGAAEETATQPVPAAPEKEVEPKTPPSHEPEDSSAARQLVEPPMAAEAPPPPVVTAETPGQVQQVQADTAGSAGVQTPPQQAQTTESAAATAQPVTSAKPDVAATPAAAGDQMQASSQQQAIPPADAQLEKQLEEARRFYWQRNLREAAAAYQALSEAYPQNADVWGEMGNVYFSLRQREPASAAYSRCIELLIDQGDQARARQLLNVLFRLDAPKARELETQMQQVGG